MTRDYDTTGQLTLDAVQDMHLNPDTLARRDDPATARAAAAGDRTTHRHRILSAFATRPAGMDYMTAARIARFDPWEVTRRVSDLVRMGLIEVRKNPDGSDSTVQLPSGRSGRVYVITSLGIAAIADAA